MHRAHGTNGFGMYNTGDAIFASRLLRAFRGDDMIFSKGRYARFELGLGGAGD